MTRMIASAHAWSRLGIFFLFQYHTTTPPSTTVARLICVLSRRPFGDISAVQPQTQKYSRRRRMRRVLESAWRLGIFLQPESIWQFFVFVVICDFP